MIQLEKVSKLYGSVMAVDNLSLTVRKSELLVVLGGSGSGKTTTLKMINRLVEPSEGVICLDGKDITEVEPHELRRHIGYVFQQVGLFPHMSVSENMAITLQLLDWSAVRIKTRVEELLALVELEPSMLNRMPSELSGGEQQRVGVARALAAEPTVMLLDEPFGSLDPLTRGRLQESFAKIRRRLGLTSILVSHDMVEALLLGDRIAVMDRGRLVQVGTPYELVRCPASDYVKQLMHTPRRQAKAVDDLLVDDEDVSDKFSQ